MRSVRETTGTYSRKHSFHKGKIVVQLEASPNNRLDVMVNNAGIMLIAPISELKVEEWDAMIDVNIKGTLYGVAAALPHFQKQDHGHFVNVSSVAGIKVISPGGTVYSGTK
jgi:NADP-dependent 3-hydroxy acid dehydrogenase YdfG